MEVIVCLEESGLLNKGVNETIMRKQKKSGFLGMLMATLGASFLGNISTGKGVI